MNDRLTVPIQPLIKDLFGTVEQRHEDNTPVYGLPTGFLGFDGRLGGLHPGTVTLVGSRPGHGKTIFALNVAAHVALEERKAVLLASLTDLPQATTFALLAARARTDVQRLRSGQLHDADWLKVATAMEDLSKAPLRVVADPLVHISKLAGLCRSHEVALLVVDRVQDLAEEDDTPDRYENVGAAIRNLKRLALQTGVCVLATSSVTRSAVSRTDPRPQLTDLADSAALEATADVVAFIHRDEVNNADSPAKGEAELIVAKSRHSTMRFTELLAFLGHSCRFASLRS